MTKQTHQNFLGVKSQFYVKRKGNKHFDLIADAHNLILDSGLDRYSTLASTELTEYCALGTGTSPVSRDSSTITASQTGTTVTASAAFFEAGDVGRLLKFDSGEEHYITTFNNTTEVIVATTASVSSAEFTIWYVDDIGLQTEVARTGTKRTDTSDNETTFSANITTHKRTHLFPAEVSAVTYNEVGWSDSGSVGNNLYNRLLIGGGVSLGIGDQALVVSNLEITQTPTTSTAVTDVGSGGFDTAGNAQIEGTGLGNLDSLGNPSGSDYLCPGPDKTATAINIGINDVAFNSYGSTKSMSGNTLSRIDTTNGSYSNGNYYVDKSATYSISNFDSASVSWICLGQSSSANNSGFRIRLTSLQGKDNTQTLALVFRVSWGRTLTN